MEFMDWQGLAVERGGGCLGGGSVSRLQYDYISMIVLIDLHLGLHLSEPAV